jgi:hypothetical protein
LRLHRLAPGWRNLLLTIAQVLGQALHSIRGTTECEFGLTDVVEDGEVWADPVRLGELLQRAFVVGLAGLLESPGEV